MTSILLFPQIIPKYATSSIYYYSLSCQACLCADLIYNVEEEQSPGTYIGNIAIDSQVMDNIPLKDHKHITFTQLQKGSSQIIPCCQEYRKTIHCTNIGC